MKSQALEVPAPQHEVSLVASTGDHPRDAPLALARLAALAPRHRFGVATTVPGRQLPQDILPPESVVISHYEGTEFTRAWARHDDLRILITAHDGSRSSSPWLQPGTRHLPALLGCRPPARSLSLKHSPRVSGSWGDRGPPDP